MLTICTWQVDVGYDLQFVWGSSTVRDVHHPPGDPVNTQEKNEVHAGDAVVVKGLVFSELYPLRF